MWKRRSRSFKKPLPHSPKGGLGDLHSISFGKVDWYNQACLSNYSLTQPFEDSASWLSYLTAKISRSHIYLCMYQNHQNHYEIHVDIALSHSLFMEADPVMMPKSCAIYLIFPPSNIPLSSKQFVSDGPCVVPRSQPPIPKKWIRQSEPQKEYAKRRCR